MGIETGGLRAALDGRHVFVTGGTGSFGSIFVELCLAEGRARSVTVFSRDEQKHLALRRRFPDTRLKTVLGDVRDLNRLRRAMRGADVVFNAAAIKQVHLTEFHPLEAVKTNILGAANVCEAALETGVEVLVSISTDKAVEPVNAMGMSKALQERVVASFAGGSTRIGVVRYGNVLASNGSVVPLFKQLIEDGAESLPVTDRRMTRFMLTLEESVNLVLLALRSCQAGETFVMNLPAFLVDDLAEVMAQHARQHGRAIIVREVGLRPGEKLHETLISPEEMRHAEQAEGYWIIRPYASSSDFFRPGSSEQRLSSDTAPRLSKDALYTLLASQRCFPILA